MHPDQLSDEMEEFSEMVQSLIVRSKQQKKDINKAQKMIADMKEEI